MSRRAIARAAAVAWLLAAITAAPASQPPRLVSLAPHLTELAYAAGVGERLVGAVEYSDTPAAAKRLPRIGDAFRFDLEGIVRLEATHALAWGGGTPADAIERLEALGLHVETFRIVRLGDIAPAIERLGRIGGQPGVAATAAAAFERRLDGFRTDPAGAPIPVFYQVSARPLFTLGGAHVINDVFELCGAVNVFADLDAPAAAVALEAVLKRDPAVLIVAEDANEVRWPRGSDMRALRCGHVLRVDPALLVRPTPRLLDGAHRLCRWLDRRVRQAGDRACRIDRD